MMRKMFIPDDVVAIIDEIIEGTKVPDGSGGFRYSSISQRRTVICNLVRWLQYQPPKTWKYICEFEGRYKHPALLKPGESYYTSSSEADDAIGTLLTLVSGLPRDEIRKLCDDVLERLMNVDPETIAVSNKSTPQDA